MRRFNLKKLHQVEGNSNIVLRSQAALEHLGAEVEINSAWEMVTKTIKILLGKLHVLERISTFQ
jgi:hypothetical protein